jgi:lipoprotein-anchoring transpeptidase ErfK/SrfK
MRTAHHLRNHLRIHVRVAAAMAALVASSVPSLAEPLAMTEPYEFPAPIFRQILPEPVTSPQPLPQASAPERSPAAVPDRLRRQVVAYDTREAPGTIVVDTPHTYLYYVLGQGRAIRYGIGVGREGFAWSGVKTIGRKQEWPDWIPPAEMIARQPYLPRFMAGGPGNPLGARAMYLGGTLYRIHGTSEPSTIGKHVSSGCIRMLNKDAIDLYNRTPLGTKVVVLPDSRREAPAHVAGASRVKPARQRLSQVESQDMPLPQRPPRPAATLPGDPHSSLYRGSSASVLY